MDIDLVYNKELTESYGELDREKALIIMNNILYESDDNHQHCLENIIQDVFINQGLNIENDEDLDKAIFYTDSKFANGELYGFDVFKDKIEGYIIAHYKNNLEGCFTIIKNYAEFLGYSLGTFINDKIFLVKE